MKSAYELALERMDAEGIGRPRQESLDDATREKMAEVRSKAEARLAELEIVEKRKLAEMRDPAAHAEAEKRYHAERLRIEEARERDLEKLRRAAAQPSAKR
jgi:hypothetical protein